MDSFKFSVEFTGMWSVASEVQPIINDSGSIIGGFIITEGPMWNCFIPRQSEEALLIEGGWKMYANPLLGDNGEINKIQLSQLPGDSGKLINH